MIRFCERNQIEDILWNNCITNAANTPVSAYTWYLDIACENWSALILGDYEAVFPLPIKSKYNVSYLLQPLFIRVLDIYSKKKLSLELVDQFFDAIPSSIKLIDLNIPENLSFHRNDFQIKNRVFQVLDLNQPYEIIKRSYNKSVQKNLRKAYKNNLSIVENVSPKKIVEMYRSNVGDQIKELKSKEYAILEKLMRASLKNNCGINMGITNAKNELIAAAFFMKSRNAIFFFKGSANTEGKSTGAMYLLLDIVFKTYAQQKEVFDFEGSSIKGIANFNKNFGATDCVYLQVKRNSLPSIVKWISGKL